MANPKKPGGRREPPGGRPPKGNSRLVCYVQPETRKYIDGEADRLGMTLGEIVDQLVRNMADKSRDTSQSPETKKSTEPI